MSKIKKAVGFMARFWIKRNNRIKYPTISPIEMKEPQKNPGFNIMLNRFNHFEQKQTLTKALC